MTKGVRMKEYFPEYYSEFRCIAGDCRHSCCKGWEIDVDEKSLLRYKDHPDIMKRIKDGSFILDSEERCPFLLSNGLCDMILKYGEDMLCDICTDHPRFRNYGTDEDGEEYVDTGLGLCCEAAAALILDRDRPFALVPARELDPVFGIMSDRNIPIERKLDILSKERMSSDERVKLFLSLERLDPAWDTMLSKVEERQVEREEPDEDVRKRLSNLVCYLLFRHGSDKLRFTAECTELIFDLWRCGYDIPECARMFSSEVEYSDINVDMLLNTFGE